MKIILTQDVKALGKKGEVVDVSDGYARNFIFPKKLGIEATAKSLNELQQKKSSEEHKKNLEKQAAVNLAEKLKDVKVIIKAKAGEGGRLFGAITNKEIATELDKQHKVKIDKKKIVLEEPIRTLGTTEVVLKLYPGINGTLSVKVSE